MRIFMALEDLHLPLKRGRWSKRITPKLKKSCPNLRCGGFSRCKCWSKKKACFSKKKKNKSNKKNGSVGLNQSMSFQNIPRTRDHPPRKHGPTCTTLKRSQLQPLGKFNMPLAPLTSSELQASEKNTTTTSNVLQGKNLDHGECCAG